jgi:hypothetical protein
MVGLVVATALLAILAVLLVAAGVALVAALPGLVDSGFIGWARAAPGAPVRGPPADAPG